MKTDLFGPNWPNTQTNLSQNSNITPQVNKERSSIIATNLYEPVRCFFATHKDLLETQKDHFIVAVFITSKTHHSNTILYSLIQGKTTSFQGTFFSLSLKELWLSKTIFRNIQQKLLQFTSSFSLALLLRVVIFLVSITTGASFASLSRIAEFHNTILLSWHTAERVKYTINS